MIIRINWAHGSVNDCITQYCIAHGINYQYDHFGRIQINGMIPYINIANDTITILA